MSKVKTCLWFDTEGEEAARFYVSLLPDSRIDDVFRRGPGEPALLVSFTLAGQSYQTLNAGPGHPPTDAASIVVMTDDQAETDRLWAALTADGGADIACSWVRDRWGVSWQIVPRRAMELFNDPDRAAAGRAFAAMTQMKKLDIAALEAAFRG